MERILHIIVLLLLINGTSVFGGPISEMQRSRPVVKNSPFETRRESSNNFEEIGIEEGGCFGKCPVYAAIINRQGTIFYRGEEYTKRHGDYVGTVNAWTLQTISDYLGTFDIFAFADRYTADVTDLGTTFILVKTRSGTKVIEDYAGTAPPKIQVLEVLIESLLPDMEVKKEKWNVNSIR